MRHGQRLLFSSATLLLLALLVLAPAPAGLRSADPSDGIVSGITTEVAVRDAALHDVSPPLAELAGMTPAADQPQVPPPPPPQPQADTPAVVQPFPPQGAAVEQTQ